jgi:hypothetical protein
MRRNRWYTGVALGLLLIGGPLARGGDLREAPRPEVCREYPRDGDAFQDWLGRVIVPGRTTRLEVEDLFRPRAADREPPHAGGAFALQYNLRKLGVRRCWPDDLLIEFDAGGRVLEFSLRSRAILGPDRR